MIEHVFNVFSVDQQIPSLTKKNPGDEAGGLGDLQGHHVTDMQVSTWGGTGRAKTCERRRRMDLAGDGSLRACEMVPSGFRKCPNFCELPHFELTF